MAIASVIEPEKYMNMGAYKNVIPAQAGNRTTVIDGYGPRPRFWPPASFYLLHDLQGRRKYWKRREHSQCLGVVRRGDQNTVVRDVQALVCRDRKPHLLSCLIAACSMVFVTTVSAGTDCPGNLMGTDTDVNLSNLPSGFYSAGDVVNCLATGSIKLGPAVTFPANAVFNMVSPQVSINDNFSVASGSRLRIVTHTGELNDTGIINYGDDASNSLTMSPVNYPGQDARYGRDYQWNDGSDGHAGFSYTKLDSQGNDLPATASSWFCVRDNVSGLVWECQSSRTF